SLTIIFYFIGIVSSDGPRLPSVSASPSAEIVEGSSVTLSCCSDANPAANYTWYKEDEDSPTASGQIFIINDFRAEHSGSYSCEVKSPVGWTRPSFPPNSRLFKCASIVNKAPNVLLGQ
uniref:Ig-like domain-containing protein n=1 Tax=Cyclopterus lumpus TaxID=8103 RepID=A0A8C2XU18_CYCLU